VCCGCVLYFQGVAHVTVIITRGAVRDVVEEREMKIKRNTKIANRSIRDESSLVEEELFNNSIEGGGWMTSIEIFGLEWRVAVRLRWKKRPGRRRL